MRTSNVLLVVAGVTFTVAASLWASVASEPAVPPAPSFKFTDVSQTSGLAPHLQAAFVHAVAWGDIDGDGRLDLFLGTFSDRNAVPYGKDKAPFHMLFRQTSPGKFERFACPEVEQPARCSGAVFADLDNDGDVELYVSTNRWEEPSDDPKRKVARDAPSKLYRNDGGEFVDISTACGAAFGDLDLDGDLDLITGPHNYHGPSRVHVFLNNGVKNGVPQFREVTQELGVPAPPQKSPHPEIQDFDNDGIPDLYWSVFFANGKERRPFICRGLGVQAGLPRFDIPKTPPFVEEILKKNVTPDKGDAMIYYVDGPAVDYDGDGRLDFLCGNWPPEGSKLFHNDTKGGNWLQVEVRGTKMNRMGVGTQVKLFAGGKLIGFQEITLNGGYSGSRPPIAHFGLGTLQACDLEVTLPARPQAIRLKAVPLNRKLSVGED